jgi:hypothetical protein
MRFNAALLGRGLKNLSRSHNRITVNHNRIFDISRVAPSIGDHDGYVLRLGDTEHEFVPPLYTFLRKLQAT